MKVEINHLTKVIQGNVVLDDINACFSCASGENGGRIYGIQGINGSGKTMLMRVICGLVLPTMGTVSIDGEIIGKGISFPRSIGLLLENPIFIDEFTGAKNLSLLCDIKRLVSQAQIGDTLRRVGLNPSDKRPFRKYSLGMKQRLAIGIALLGHPEFLVLDEPINGLDPAGIKEIRDVILALNQKKGVTFLVSSHLLDELSKIVTTYGIIKDGVLIEQITAKELEGRCRHHLKLRVDNIPKAQALLECIADPKAVKIQDDCIYLFELLDKSDKVNRLLVRHGIKVSELSVQTASLEEYFLERMGK